MFKKKVKLEIPPQLRIEIIHANFFNYLKENKISQKKYSEDNNVPESTISKWKSCTSNMNEDHIIQAAKYFNITVNMLYYTKQELKEINVLENTDYDPIMAQQQKVIESIEYKVSESISFLFVNVLLIVFMALFISYFANEYGSFMIMLIFFLFPIVSLLIFKSSMVKQETYIINYLDQIYYKTNAKKNKYFLITLIFYIVQFLLVTGLFICVTYWIVKYGYYDLLQIIFSISLVSMIVLIYCLLYQRLKMKEKIYDIEVDDYNHSLVSFVINLVLTICTIPFLVYTLSLPWLIAILLIIPGLSIVNVLLISKKYSMYYLVLYDHKEDSERKLFNK